MVYTAITVSDGYVVNWSKKVSMASTDGYPHFTISEAGSKRLSFVGVSGGAGKWRAELLLPLLCGGD